MPTGTSTRCSFVANASHQLIADGDAPGRASAGADMSRSTSSSGESDDLERIVDDLLTSTPAPCTSKLRGRSLHSRQKNRRPDRNGAEVEVLLTRHRDDDTCPKFPQPAVQRHESTPTSATPPASRVHALQISDGRGTDFRVSSILERSCIVRARTPEHVSASVSPSSRACLLRCRGRLFSPSAFPCLTRGDRAPPLPAAADTEATASPGADGSEFLKAAAGPGCPLIHSKREF